MLQANGRCRSCDAAIAWAVTVHGKQIPLDLASRVDGNLVLDIIFVEGVGSHHRARKPDALLDRGKKKFVSHFVTCPNADEHRK